MQEIQIQPFEFINVDKTSPFGKPPVVTPVSFEGRVAVRYVQNDLPRQALVRAQPDWEIHLFEDVDDIYTCAFDANRDSICLERFRKGDVPRVQLLEGPQRAAVLGASFASDDPATLVNAAKASF